MCRLPSSQHSTPGTTRTEPRSGGAAGRYPVAMHVRSCDQAKATEVVADGASGVAMQMMVGREDAAPNFAMRHFVVASGGHTPLHQHPWEHEVFVVEGRLRAKCGDESRTISAGDAALVPPDTLHQFVNESESVARILCLVPLESDCGQDVPGS